MSNNKVNPPWEPKDKVNYTNLYGRKIVVYDIYNVKTEGILTNIFLTTINNCEQHYGLVMKPFNKTSSHTFGNDVIEKVEIDCIDKIKPLVISKCEDVGCLDVSNIILNFTNTYIEI